MFNDNYFNLDKEIFLSITSFIYEKLLNLYQKDEILGAYLTPYKNSVSKGQINITVLIKSDNKDVVSYYKQVISDINKDCSIQFEIPILFCIDSVNKYSMNTSIGVISIEELLNSDILFDKDNFLQKIKDSFNNNETLFNFDTINFSPSISEEVAFRLYKKFQ